MTSTKTRATIEKILKICENRNELDLKRIILEAVESEGMLTDAPAQPSLPAPVYVPKKPQKNWNYEVWFQSKLGREERCTCCGNVIPAGDSACRTQDNKWLHNICTTESMRSNPMLAKWFREIRLPKKPTQTESEYNYDEEDSE